MTKAESTKEDATEIIHRHFGLNNYVFFYLNFYSAGISDTITIFKAWWLKYRLCSYFHFKNILLEKRNGNALSF